MAKFPLPQIGAQLRSLGASYVFVRRLAPNNNSKNQIYVGQDISELSLLRPGEIQYRQGSSEKQKDSYGQPIFHAPLNFWWLTPSGNLAPAPNAKLVVHPQYAKHGEVRISGILQACRDAPAQLFDKAREGTTKGRVLIIAPLDDGRLVGLAFGADSTEAKMLHQVDGDPYAVFHRYELIDASTDSSESELLSELYRIHSLGWLNPETLGKNGIRRPCNGTNCGGVTLETHLGIMPNGYAEPDFHGWEIKQHGVGSLDRPKPTVITLLTPEPTGGSYQSNGPEFFVRTWGYADQNGRDDRLNFGGIYRVSETFHHRTNLRLVLDGYDPETERIRGDGSVVLIDPSDRVAASWSFAKLMDHWKKKHARAAFVPSEMRIDPTRQYRYGTTILLGEGAQFRRLLKALHDGVVYYDPGIKLESASGERPKIKRRSQFRVVSSDLASLYETTREVTAKPAIA